MNDELLGHPVVLATVSSLSFPGQSFTFILNHTPLNTPPFLYDSLDKSQDVTTSINKTPISFIKLVYKLLPHVGPIPLLQY